ncbi:hypothetical protein A9Q94_12570 [Rhodobacterales bacterium 56_14_T64]|nr:hypothetical protein A9Q94_12570 [Rhodobacterales bacterium 56_14_T64]
MFEPERIDQKSGARRDGLKRRNEIWTMVLGADRQVAQVDKPIATASIEVSGKTLFCSAIVRLRLRSLPGLVWAGTVHVSSRISVDFPAAQFFVGRCPVPVVSEQEMYSLRENNMQSDRAHLLAKLCVVMVFAL